MAANNFPIYTRVGSMSAANGTTFSSTLTTGSDTYTGANAAAVVCFTADATNGSFVQRLRCKAIGTNTASVLRVWINNGSANTTAANNKFYGELSLPATTASATAATVDLDYPMNLALDPGFRIVVQLATTVAAGWDVIPVAGKY